MEYGLIGEKLPHSFSVRIHARLGDYPYELKELAPDRLPEIFRKRDFRAINVTIPYKRDVLPFLDEVDPFASAIGAVNTVVNRDGRLYGYNTDFYGMQALLRHIGIDAKGKKVLILGTGGTCRTATAVLSAAKAAQIVTVGRSERADLSLSQAYERHGDAQILINTTPCGMYPYADGSDSVAASPADPTRFAMLEGVADAVYNPLRTNFVLDARAMGIPAQGGLYMLVAQAVRANRLFFGKPLDDAETDVETERIFRAVSAETENIVLIGMPASGKSTVGRLLSGRTGRRWLDTDEEICRRTGKTVPEIFAERGEDGFRDLESEVIRELACGQTGCILSTGGGAVLREENVRRLRRTGRVYFLDRDPSLLVPTPDRPLALTAEAIARLYGQRYPRYCDACDVRVDASSSAQEVAEFIRKDFML